MLTTVESLFEKIKKVSKQYRQNNKSFDGKKFWQPIKIILSETNWKATKWKKQSSAKYSSIMNIPEFYINGFGKTQIIEKNHFLIQTVRLPQGITSLKKICQIALNIGQYEGYTGITIENNNINNYLLKNDCNVQLKEIFDEHKIKELEKILDKNY